MSSPSIRSRRSKALDSMRARGHSLFTAAVAACLCAAFAACDGQQPDAVEARDRPGRVLVLGIDGASIELLRPLMLEGRMPNLERLAAEGASGTIRSLDILLSPRIWTSVATGKRPELHGIRNWVTGARDSQRLVTSHDRKVHALWNILTRAGLSVATVNWLITFPTEPVRGVVLSDYALPGSAEGRAELFLNAGREDERSQGAPGTHSIGAPTTYPEDWEEVVSAVKRARGPALSDVPNPFARNQLLSEDAQCLSFTALREDDRHVRLALRVDEELRPDLMMVLLQGIDRSSHWLWGAFEPPEAYPEKLRFGPREREAAAKALLAYYEFTDDLIGHLLDRYTEEDLVLILSDHGFEAATNEHHATTGGHKSERARDGVFFARGPGIPAGLELAQSEMSVLDVTPMVLAWLGLPVAQDMQGKLPGFFTPPSLVRAIETYETLPVPRHELRPAGVEDAVLEQLQSLGYVK